MATIDAKPYSSDGDDPSPPSATHILPANSAPPTRRAAAPGAKSKDVLEPGAMGPGQEINEVLKAGARGTMGESTNSQQPGDYSEPVHPTIKAGAKGVLGPSTNSQQRADRAKAEAAE